SSSDRKWDLRVSLTGLVASARFGKLELVPSLLERLTDSPVGLQAAVMIGTSLLIIGVVVLLFRSYDQIAKWLFGIPEKEGIHVDRQYNVNVEGDNNLVSQAEFMVGVKNTVQKNV